MHALALVALVVLALTVLLRVLEWSGRPIGGRSLISLVALGSAVGLLAALFVLSQSEDLIPDQLEATVLPFYVVLVTAALLVLARRPSPGV